MAELSPDEITDRAIKKLNAIHEAEHLSFIRSLKWLEICLYLIAVVTGLWLVASLSQGSFS